MPRGVPGRYSRTVLDKSHPIVTAARAADRTARPLPPACAHRFPDGRQCIRATVGESAFCECHYHPGEPPAPAPVVEWVPPFPHEPNETATARTVASVGPDRTVSARMQVCRHCGYEVRFEEGMPVSTCQWRRAREGAAARV